MTGGAGVPVTAPVAGGLTVRARAANPLLGLREFQHEYDEPQVEDQMAQQ
jgi:hypothetical protein